MKRQVWTNGSFR